jgi:hypothetical protein
MMLWAVTQILRNTQAQAGVQEPSPWTAASNFREHGICARFSTVECIPGQQPKYTFHVGTAGSNGGVEGQQGCDSLNSSRQAHTVPIECHSSLGTLSIQVRANSPF